MSDITEVRSVICYQATRNSSGVLPVQLRVRGDGYIIGQDTSTYVPWGHVNRLGKDIDWRTRSIFATRDEAVWDYVTIEKRRLEKAQEALKQIGEVVK